jgi:hypothetical protein
LQLALGSQLLAGGWIASFTAQSDVSWISRAILLALAALAIAGAIRRAFANGLDGWYALVSIAVMLAWIFPEDNQRRLLYSVLPLLLVHAASTAISVVDGFGPPKWRRPILAALALAPMLLCLPATILVARKSMEREPFAMAGEYTAADITDYYTTINVGHARAIAARHAAVLHGFERLKRDTPIESRVMWTRPEYVALLGERQSVPLYYHWDARALAIAIRESKTTHVVWSLLSKSDLRRQNRAVADHLEILRTVGDYASAAYAVRNAVTNQEDFVLLKVDAQRLDAYLAK